MRTFTMLLRAAAFACDLRAARRCLREMRRRALASDEAVVNACLHVLLRLAGLCFWHERRSAPGVSVHSRSQSPLSSRAPSFSAAFSTSTSSSAACARVSAHTLAATRSMLASEARALVAVSVISSPRTSHLLLQVLLATGRVDEAAQLVLERASSVANEPRRKPIDDGASQQLALQLRQVALVARLLRRPELERALDAAREVEEDGRDVAPLTPALARFERRMRASRLEFESDGPGQQPQL